jgi:hypothetical protein
MQEPEELSSLEMMVVQQLLAGEHPVLRILQQQFEAARVARRDLTGVGFYTYFSVDDTAPRVNDMDDFCFGDVHADLVGVKNGCGFLLWVSDSVLDNLEGYTYDESWPPNAQVRRVYYMREDAAQSGHLVETIERDVESLFRRR